ncbi:response regulator [Paenibacillus mendelii]|uniref:Response regulator n=1 Tax=Paenibacillus mendelii TaxID=206163 RepID=A0ABV6JC79_9BACL|nr:response regulator [Paenibacillus mendelii]MCQ6561511.1 response regulator [Paenibacillus mendelii]
MYKLILVDDSERVRKGLQASVNWSEHRIEIAGEAEDGEAALELIAQVKPDLILTDVVMPHMTGLELIGRALEIVPLAKVILLSGYDQFDYVQSAIRSGAFDYLLKPTKVEELLAVVNKAKQSMEQERGQIKGIVELKQQLHESIPVLKERHLRHLLDGRVPLSEIREKYGYLKLSIGDNRCVCLVLELDEDQVLTQHDRDDDRQLVKFACRNITEELFKDKFHTEMIENSDSQLVMIVSGRDPQDLEHDIERLLVLLRKMRAYILNYYKMRVSIGIGNVYESPEWIVPSYKEAAEAMKYRLYAGDEGFIFYREISSFRMQEATVYPYELEKKLCLALKAGDKEEATAGAKEFLQAIVGGQSPDPEQLRNICCQLVYTMLRMLVEWNISDGRVVDFTALDGQMRKWTTTRQAESWLIHYVEELSDMIAIKMQQRSTSMVQKAIAFMEQQYARDLSLHEVADAVHLTPNYLANLFKLRTGETILNVLSGIRMDKAKELLRNTDMKTYEIARAVGFADAKYFGQVFKKVVGATPQDYKRQ